MRFTHPSSIILAFALFFSSVPVQGCQRSKAPVVKTSFGQIRVQKAVLSDRWPPDCPNPPSIGCDGVREGFVILAVYLEPLDGTEIPSDIFSIAKNVTVVSGDGTMTEMSMAGTTTSSSGSTTEAFICFTPKVSESNFELRWPDNPGVKLTISPAKP